MRQEALNDSTKAVWEKCVFLKDDFYLAGGTALALQIGHRKSVDLDFFCALPIKKTLLGKIEDHFKATLAPVVRSVNELTLFIQGVKVTFLHYPFPLLHQTVKEGMVPLASVRDLASMKAYSLGRRGTLKDYVDLYTVFSKNLVKFEEVINDANQKYSDAFNDRLFCEQLLYTDDIEDEAIEWIEKPVSIEEIKAFFRNLLGEKLGK